MKQFLTITTLVLMAFAAYGSPVKSEVAAKGISFSDDAGTIPSASDYIQDGLVLCLDAIENVAMGVSDHSVPYVFNIATEGDYYRLDKITFNEETKSFSRPRSYSKPVSNDSFCAPFRNLKCTIDYVASPTVPSGQFNAWGCGVNPTTNGWAYVFVSSRYNILQVSQDGSFYSDVLTPSQRHHSTIVIDGKTMFSYCEGEYDKQKNFISEGYQYCNQFSFASVPRYDVYAIEEMRCFRLYNRVLSDEEIAWNYQVDLLRYGEGGDDE